MVSQNVIPGRGKLGGALPFAFTEQGVAMLSSVLRSKRAVQVNIAIMRAFVRLRELLSTHADLARKLEAMEKKYDTQFKVVFDAIRQIMSPRPQAPKKKSASTSKNPPRNTASLIEADNFILPMRSALAGFRSPQHRTHSRTRPAAARWFPLKTEH